MLIALLLLIFDDSFLSWCHREGSSCLKICWGPNDLLMDLVLNNLDDCALMIFAKNLWIWKEAMSKSYHFFAYDHKQDWLPWAKIAPWVKFEMNRRKCFFRSLYLYENTKKLPILTKYRICCSCVQGSFHFNCGFYFILVTFWFFFRKMRFFVKFLSNFHIFLRIFRLFLAMYTMQ